jgi:glycosyltransferase involved in cell wall biosynthesis
VKILQLIQKKQLRGAEVFAAQLSTHLVEQGHEILMVALLDGKDQLPFNGNIIVLHASLGRKLYDFKGWKKLSKIIADFKPDLIQANAGDTLKYAVFSKLFFRWKQPLVFRNASMVSHYARTYFSRLLLKFFFRSTDHIVSVSNITRTDLIDHFKIAANKINTIPIGIELKTLQPVTVFDTSKINIIHVGGFSFEKNHKGLLSIFKKLIVQNENYRLWLIGDGKLKTETEALAEELNLTPYTRFLGYVHNPMDYIHGADLLVLPSIIEGLPGVITEAFYCKTPVVAYHVGGIADLIEDKKTGRLIKVGDEQSFVNAVLAITSSSEDEKNQMKSAAYQKVMEGFTNKQIALRFATTYESLLTK